LYGKKLKNTFFSSSLKYGKQIENKVSILNDIVLNKVCELMI